MPEQSIRSDDMSIKRLFQDFYRVPDYQREYVWGERDPKGERGDEVDQFLDDIHTEFQGVTRETAPEYFIGMIVVCPSTDNVLELIDGQQRLTTTFLVLCAIRDRLTELGQALPEDLPRQIDASETNWRGEVEHRLRLDLQYEDAADILRSYAQGTGGKAPARQTRSIKNIANAYGVIAEFLRANFEDADRLRAFYGYLTNKVILIRIMTPSVATALKIFETINDRGIGLDAMDLLKNLLFRSANARDFATLKTTWKSITDAIFEAREKPLRFLRYFLFASFPTDPRLREDAIYDWFRKNDAQTRISEDPIAFADRLLKAANIYRNFTDGRGPLGELEAGIINTRYLGGKSIRQHFILLLAGSHLEPEQFSKLSREVEKTVFVWLVTNTPTRDYERLIVEWAGRLRELKAENFDAFIRDTLTATRQARAQDFDERLNTLKTWDMRAFRMRYLVAKLTQHIDLQGFGDAGGQAKLSHYMDGKNDIEHILSQSPSAEALVEFNGEDEDAGEPDPELIQRLGNLLLLEDAVNRSIQNDRYSTKIAAYPSSQFLLTRCQAGSLRVGVNDRITRATQGIPAFKKWNRQAVRDRQCYLAKLAKEVWGVAPG